MFGALLFTVAACCPPVAAFADPDIRWRGETYQFDTLPDDLPLAALAAIEAWYDWAEIYDYALELDPDGRVLLLSRAGNRRVDAQMKLVAKTVAFFDSRLPRPNPAEMAAITGGGDEKADDKPDKPTDAQGETDPDAPLPEDPDGEIPPWELEGFGDTSDIDTGSEPYSYTWGSDEVGPDRETIVFLVLRTESDYRSVLELLGKEHPYLASWLPTAADQQGFALQQPLAGAYIETADGQEEWNPDAEIVNRLTQLLTVRRFGPLPNWLIQGTAWGAEFAVRGSVYCFPYRSEFVGIEEHVDWDKRLARDFKGRKKKSKHLRAHEFANWKRGGYSAFPARVSWGLVEFMALRFADELPRVAQAFADYRDEHNRIDGEDGTWERDRGFAIPVDTQEELLERYTQDDLMSNATRFFRAGMPPE
jgi:hypothetical protein